LWTDWFSEAFWLQEKRSQGPRNWSALYQQQPSPDDGIYFKREDFFRYDMKDVPKVRKYRTGDFAVTEEAEAEDPDYTELGIDGVANVWMQDDQTDQPFEVTKIWLCLDGWSGRKSPDDWLQEYFTLQLRHKPDCEFAEVGVIRRAIEGIMNQQRLRRRAIGQIEWMPHIGDKQANARALQALAKMGLVGVPNTDYGDYVIEQLIKFPTARHDDVVDMCALIGRAVDEAHPMLNIPSAPQPETDRYDKAFSKYDDADDDWKAA
jgi:phage terminase large subunit-like protein